jgi:hypothetical protein
MPSTTWSEIADSIRTAIARNDWTALEISLPGEGYQRRFRSWAEVRDVLEYCERRAADEVAGPPRGRTSAVAGRRLS